MGTTTTTPTPTTTQMTTSTLAMSTIWTTTVLTTSTTAVQEGVPSPWRVVSGECSVTPDRCLQSPGFPKPYGTSQNCLVSTDSQFWATHTIVVESFDTESKWDYLMVNGQ